MNPILRFAILAFLLALAGCGRKIIDPSTLTNIDGDFYYAPHKVLVHKSADGKVTEVWQYLYQDPLVKKDMAVFIGEQINQFNQDGIKVRSERLLAAKGGGPTVDITDAAMKSWEEQAHREVPPGYGVNWFVKREGGASHDVVEILYGASLGPLYGDEIKVRLTWEQVAKILDEIKTPVVYKPPLPVPANAEQLRALRVAEIRGNVDTVKAILSQHPELINTPDEMGITPFSWGLRNKSMAELLLTMKANPTLKNRIRGETVLLPTIRGRDPEMIEFLLDHGCSVNETNINGETPLHWAALSGRDDIVEMLLKHGADVNARANDGRTPLFWALAVKRMDAVEVLRKHGATDEGTLPFAIVAGDIQKVKALIAHDKALVNTRDDGGSMPLHWATMTRQKDIVALLLDSGADVNAETVYNWTAMELAVNYRSDEIVELLRSHGAKS